MALSIAYNIYLCVRIIRYNVLGCPGGVASEVKGCSTDVMCIIKSEKYGDVLFVSSTDAWQFSAPESVIACYNQADVVDALRRVDIAIGQGRYVAGFLAYEAGWPLLGRPSKQCAAGLPLIWFGVYKERAPVSPARPGPTDAPPPPLMWTPQLRADAYRSCYDRVRAYIGAGDVYQINLTFPLTTHFQGDPSAWFWRLHATQPTDHAAYLDLGRYKILSLSPELFFRLQGDVLTTRPMKGTLPRGPYPEADAQARAQLYSSEKDRAENVMIVDLLRNDMGRISATGSVQVKGLFDIERYATVWQMTSTIQSRTNASFSELMIALFPSGSVTGAPKIRAMEIIDELEATPRGVYCGAIGWWGPNRQAAFNVAIRTLTVDTHTYKATYPVGGGITWYSNVNDEYAECIAKAKTVMAAPPSFSLLETILYDDVLFLLEAHLDRLCASAAFFNIPMDRQRVRAALVAAAENLSEGRWKIRLCIHRNGAHQIEAAPLPDTTIHDPFVVPPYVQPPTQPNYLQVSLATTPVDKSNQFLYHKTTHRAVYEEAKKNCPDADDVLLWNEAGELTESTIANIVVELDGKRITPPVSCGLLAGVMRGALLRKGEIQEGIIHKHDLERIGALFLVNSVRGWMRASLKNE